MDKKQLEDMSKEELIALILEDLENSQLREEDVAGTEQALAAETIQADHYAKMLAEADKLIAYYQQGPDFESALDEASARALADLTSDAIEAAIQHHAARQKTREEELARRAARAATRP